MRVYKRISLCRLDGKSPPQAQNTEHGEPLSLSKRTSVPEKGTNPTISPQLNRDTVLDKVWKKNNASYRTSCNVLAEVML